MRETWKRTGVVAVLGGVAAVAVLSCGQPDPTPTATPASVDAAGEPAVQSNEAPAGSSGTGDAGSASNPGTEASSTPQQSESPQAQPYEAVRPFSPSTECKVCHPRQYQEWRTSPHAYSGISPTFYSLVAAGQNSFGAGALINVVNPDLGNPGGTSVGGAVGNFCLPCHSPMSFLGLEGRLAGNNLGFGDVTPDGPFVCNLASGEAVFQQCTVETSAEICGLAGRCNQFEGRSCVNMPPVDEGTLFPRVRQHCFEDSDCSGADSGCPPGQDCGPCIIAPATIYYSQEGQEGINCESCHNILPNHQRACQQFRNSDSVGVLSVDIQERDLDGVRLRLGPYPVADTSAGQGRANDTLSPVRNAFHESARVDTPLVVNYADTDWAGGVRNPANNDAEIIRPTAVTCEELPYCRAGICEGGPLIGEPCGAGPDADFNCGGCSSAGTCGLGSDRAGQACRTSIDCTNIEGAAASENLMNRGVADGTLGPLFRRDLGGGNFELDRPDGNYYRSSMFCGACHDVRPPLDNTVLRSCQLQDTHVCSTDDDCRGLNVGCPGNDCGPCVAENGSSPEIEDAPSGDDPGVGGSLNAAGMPRNTGVRRVENLFTEWQISAYNHPELSYCSGNAFRVCNIDTDCSDFNDGTCSITSPTSQVITCQDCHMSLFPRVPLVRDLDGDGTPETETAKNDLYPQNKAAIEGSQADITQALPVRRVSTHGMPGVDLPLIPFPGQQLQNDLRQELLDSAYKIDVDTFTPDTATPGEKFDVEVEITNVGVGHRVPSGFSHERQNWVQLYVQSRDRLQELGIENDPFADNAPCNLQRTIATGADQAADASFADQAGAALLGAAGCVYRSGFILDKAHPETGEMTPDGNFGDEDPEDFFVVAGTRMRGNSGDPGDPADGGDERIEVNPGPDGRALAIQYICEEATAEAYLEGIRDGSGIDVRAPESSFPHQARFCDPNRNPQIPGEGPRDGSGIDPGEAPVQNGIFNGTGFTAPGFGNPNCMEEIDGELEDLGPCVPEIELSDADERGRCALDLTRTGCQRDADCGDAGPCLYACSGFPELQCCDEEPGTACEVFYDQIGSGECLLGFEDPGPNDNFVCVGGLREGQFCSADGADAECTDDPDGTMGECEPQSDVSYCIRGPHSGEGCTTARQDEICNRGSIPPGEYLCGSVGECVVENRGIVNFQNQFRATANGVCVDPANARDDENLPIPVTAPGVNDGNPVGCLLNLSCTLQGLGGSVCLVNGQCADDSNDGTGREHGDACTNVTYREDCGTRDGNSIACNVERNVELNGRPSESVFLQNHPFNFNSLPPLEPRLFFYDFEIPEAFADTELIVSARIMNRHFPMRFLRNLIGTQVIRPPFIVENQGDPSDPGQCTDPRTIDIDCFVRPIVILGNAEPGGYFPPQQAVRTATIEVEALP